MFYIYIYAFFKEINITSTKPPLSGNFEIWLQSADNLLHYKILSTHLLHWVQIWPAQSSYCSAMEWATGLEFYYVIADLKVGK